ncbi:MAG: MraZ N-terminal domain-containing protein, partial [Bacteroidota bacterium]
MQLIGEYTVALDEKGRLRVPSALLRQLGEKPDGEGYEFVINRGFE